MPLWANPFQLHQPLTAVVSFGHTRQDPIVFSDVIFNAINVFPQIINGEEIT